MYYFSFMKSSVLILWLKSTIPIVLHIYLLHFNNKVIYSITLSNNRLLYWLGVFPFLSNYLSSCYQNISHLFYLLNETDYHHFYKGRYNLHLTYMSYFHHPGFKNISKLLYEFHNTLQVWLCDISMSFRKTFEIKTSAIVSHLIHVYPTELNKNCTSKSSSY